jgi:type IV pilus assembly protein PilA
MKAAINNLRLKRKDEGFTLVELLVVVVIIGVLVAIAIPMYGSYRKGAANKSAQSDVRGAISAVEQFYTENANSYPATADAVGGDEKPLVFGVAPAVPQTATVSPGNTLSYATKGTGYVLCAQNDEGKAVYVYNSEVGGSVTKSTKTTISDCLTAGA